MKSILLVTLISLIPFSHLVCQKIDSLQTSNLELPSKVIVGMHLHFYSGYEILEKSDAHTALMFPLGFDVRLLTNKIIYDFNISYTFIDLNDGFTSYVIGSMSMGFWNNYGGIVSFGLVSMIPIFNYDYLFGVEANWENSLLPVSISAFKNSQFNRNFIFFSVKIPILNLKVFN